MSRTNLGCPGYRAAQAGIRTGFTIAADLLLTLTAAHAQNHLKSVMHRATGSYRPLIVDEIGYLPMSGEQTNPFFQVIAVRYEKGSLIVTRNFPFGQWDATCAKTVRLPLLDCLLLHPALCRLPVRAIDSNSSIQREWQTANARMP